MLFEELLLLRQGNGTVDDYTNKFHELSLYSHIRKELLTVRIVSIEEAHQLPLWVEQQYGYSPPQRTANTRPLPTPPGTYWL